MEEEIKVTRAIFSGAIKDWLDNLEVEVAIAGGGPAGLVAAKYLTENGMKICIFERKLSPGGGMWGGGMMFPKIVIQEEAKSILDDFGIKYEREEKHFVADSIQATARLIAGAIESGTKIFNGISVEDVVIRKNKITGVVINYSAIEIARLHVDPVAIGASWVIDATGHPAEVCRVVEKKVGRLNTPSGKIEGEKSMWLVEAEKLVVENTKEVYPGLVVCGMAANAVFGSPRMGPIFGGMLLSGKRAAELILEKMK